MQDRDERDQVRDAYQSEPGKGGQVERALGERENARAYGTDSHGADKQLDQLGWGENRAGAAAARKRAVEQGERPPDGDPAPGTGPSAPPVTAGDDGPVKPPRARAPEGRTAPPRSRAHAEPGPAAPPEAGKAPGGPEGPDQAGQADTPDEGERVSQPGT